MAYVFSRIEKVVAIFIIFAIIIVISLVVLLNSQKAWLKRKYTYTTEFKTANGLNEGMKITLQSIPIGRLTGYDLNVDNRISANLEIYSEYVDRIREDSVLVLSAPPIGGAQLLLYPGSPHSEQLEDKAFLPSSDTERGALLKQKHEMRMQSGTIDSILNDVSGITGQINDPNGSIQKTLAHVEGILAEVEASAHHGNIYHLLHDPRFRDELFSILANVNTTLASVDSTLSNVNTLVVDLTKKDGQLYKTLGTVDSILISLSNTLVSVDTLVTEDVTKLVNTLNNDIDALINEDIRNLLRKSVEPLLDETLTTLLEEDIPDLLDNNVKNTLTNVDRLLYDVDMLITNINRLAAEDIQDILNGLKNNPLISSGLRNQPVVTQPPIVTNTGMTNTVITN